MVYELINDMNKALDNDCYLSALAIALMLPDICAKAEYPEEKSNRKRYITWYDEYIGECFKDPESDKTPYLSGEVIYSLRCNFLHQGTPNVEKDGIKEDCCKIDKFTLVRQKKNDLEMYFDMISTTESKTSDIPPETPYRTYDVNIRGLCQKIDWCVSSYYKKNKEKFNFFNYTITDFELD
jgi:hypothetical protein